MVEYNTTKNQFVFQLKATEAVKALKCIGECFAVISLKNGASKGEKNVIEMDRHQVKRRNNAQHHKKIKNTLGCV